MGKALRDGYRSKAFLMTKIDGRTAEGGDASRSTSRLRRLQTDHIDLVQIHEVIRMEDPDRVFGPGGAIEALLAGAEGRQDALSSVSRGTRARTSICTCWSRRTRTASVSTRCRCR